MPLDIRSQVVTALDNINRNPELYTPPKPTIPLETRINDLKEANPSKYRDYISTLTSSANSGNEVAPRVTQIKNFLGITDGKTLMTPESLRQGFEKYIESGRFDNDISTLYNAVTNWEEFAKWVNASVPSIGAYVLVRGSDGKIHGEKVEKHNIY